MKKLNLLTATFDIPLKPHQVPHFRSGVVDLIGREHDLFHNHNGKGFHIRYPLIQYKLNRKKAGILGIGKGNEALYYLITGGHTEITFGGETFPFRLMHLQNKACELRVTEKPRTYRLFRWIALNQQNYEHWKSGIDFEAKSRLLKKQLAAHIISFARGVEWRIEERFNVKIININQTKMIKFKNTPLMAFDVDFEVNLQLPPEIGLGKAVGFGFGKTLPLRVDNKTKSTSVKVENNVLKEG